MAIILVSIALHVISPDCERPIITYHDALRIVCCQTRSLTGAAIDRLVLKYAGNQDSGMASDLDELNWPGEWNICSYWCFAAQRQSCEMLWVHSRK